ncbi:MAG: hypothetical protein AABZ06_05300 [Bdellovibrionota bacterium]
MRKIFICLIIFQAFSLAANADSNRMKNKIGAHIGLLGDPFPTLVGFNLNYNVLDFLRATAGYGSISASTSATVGSTTTSSTLTATTIGVGARAFVPGWNFSPVLGLSWANVSISATGTVSTTTVGGFGVSASHLYASIGFDWQTDGGFNLGGGYNLSLKSGVGGLPYINLGWYFDFLK